MDSSGDGVLSSSQIEALLREPLARWPEGSPVAVRDIVDSTHGVEAAVLAVVVDAASLDRSGFTEQVVAALSEAVAGTYPAWLPEAEHLAGPGGVGLAAERTICQRVACNSDLFGPFLRAAAEASLCGRPVDVAEFAQETVVRQARKLILRAYGYGHLVIMIELRGTWNTAQIEIAEADALWLAGPGELTVRLTARQFWESLALAYRDAMHREVGAAGTQLRTVLRGLGDALGLRRAEIERLVAGTFDLTHLRIVRRSLQSHLGRRPGDQVALDVALALTLTTASIMPNRTSETRCCRGWKSRATRLARIPSARAGFRAGRSSAHSTDS